MIADGSLAVAFGIGIAFGWTLERAGLGSARKLVGQFIDRSISFVAASSAGSTK